MSKIQISERFFVELYKFVSSDGLNGDKDYLMRSFQAKFDALSRRELYSQSKTAKTAEERERARLAYLEKVGIPDDFKW